MKKNYPLFAISSEAISKGMYSKADISNIPYGHTSYCFFACDLHTPKNIANVIIQNSMFSVVL